MTIHKFSVQQKNIDPRNESYKRGAHALGFHQLQRMECQDLYFIEGQLSQEELQQLALKLLSDPVTQTVIWDELPAPHTPPEADSVILEVSLRPGVTDPSPPKLSAPHMRSDLTASIVPPQVNASPFTLTHPFLSVNP
jgi:phosphoribosylformylglycinamidine (FGAM) synthase PurS component